MAQRIRLTKLVGIGFALGSLGHATGFVLLLFGVEMYAHAPVWKQAALTVVDALIAYLAFRRPERLFVPVLAFLIEQVAVNGPFAWRFWHATGEIPWGIPLMWLLISAATVVALRERNLVGVQGSPTIQEMTRVGIEPTAL